METAFQLYQLHKRAHANWNLTFHANDQRTTVYRMGLPSDKYCSCETSADFNCFNAATFVCIIHTHLDEQVNRSYFYIRTQFAGNGETIDLIFWLRKTKKWARKKWNHRHLVNSWPSTLKKKNDRVEHIQRWLICCCTNFCSEVRNQSA